MVLKIGDDDGDGGGDDDNNDAEDVDGDDDDVHAERPGRSLERRLSCW